ncbi:hypothetical protein PW52_04955 [Tamlana sedimentorum]|uniref:Glycoside-hydrolase family GH114 TIM-barrel domain-containing protein n=1 Tax=Neotamlana sedimentorum TaxID=1435349 RepID=A0A0D7WBB8_9FLAO|nr:hypothetical protein PW52_04955 [Tamlana sedimentorum]
MDEEVVTELTISDGTLFEPKDFYPKFSWSVTPQYCMFGDGSRTLTPSEISIISEKSDFICLEKDHAWKELGYAEMGAKHEVAAFKQIKPDIKVLYYFNSAYAWPFTSYNENFTTNKIDDYPELKKFLIINEETGELEHRNNIFFFDVLNPDFRRWWVETVVSGVTFSGADGVFIDQMHGFSWLRNDKAEEVKLTMGEMMASLKEKLGADKILLGNNAARLEDVFPVIDATMFEHYSETVTNSKENLLKEWDDMLRIAKAGKISIYRFGVEVENDVSIEGLSGSEKENALEQLSKERLEYYHACYLIGAQPYAYFQYGWGWRLWKGPLVDYPELNKPLGLPKGAYKRVIENGWEFTREFENASVWVNTETKEGKVSWK